MFYDTVQAILATDGDVRGTVAALAREIDDHELNGKLFSPSNLLSNKIIFLATVRFSLGPSVTTTLRTEHEQSLIFYYNHTYPNIQVLHRASHELPSHSQPNFLTIKVQYHDYIILDGRRISASKSHTKAKESFVQMDIGSTHCVGQIFGILTHKQAGCAAPEHLLDVRWFERLRDVDTTPWEP